MFNEGFFLTGLQENCKKKKKFSSNLWLKGRVSWNLHTISCTSRRLP